MCSAQITEYETSLAIATVIATFCKCMRISNIISSLFFFSLFIHFFFSSFDLHLQLQFAFIFVGLSGILLREYYVFLIQYILLRNKRCEGQWQWKPIDCLSHFGCCEFALFQLIWLIKSILRCLSLKVEVIFAFFFFRTTYW